MDHAAAHEELADLVLEPHRLRRLFADDTPVTMALRAHLTECADCRAELDAWRAVHAALDVTTAEASRPLRSLEPSEAPAPSAALRERTLAAVSAAGRTREVPPGARVEPEPARLRQGGPRGFGAMGRLGRLGWLAAAAALVVAVGLGGLLVDRTSQADQARLEASELGAATATLDRILATPTHWSVTLHTADGAPGGTLAWSPSEMVVLTSALTPATPGTTYRCWVERDGSRTPVGTMSFGGGLGYWAGSMAAWGSFEPGSRFGVTAIPAGASEGPAVLVADL